MKVYLDMVGCRLNQSELEAYARQFRAAGHTLVASPGEADLVVINTCTVTAAAAADSRAKIRQAQRAGAPQIAVTGCWSTLQPQEAQEIPGVQYVIPNGRKDGLVREILPEYEVEPVARQPIPGARLRTRAFIKVQDGCDQHCTFCVTRLARGVGRSRPIPEVLEDIRAALEESAPGVTGSDALDGYAHEIVLSGVHLGSWGQDFSPPRHLSDLISIILNETPVQRLRLSSLEPWDLDEHFFTLWEDKRLCRHLHLPLQSGCAETLHRMARRTKPEEYVRLVAAAREAIEGVAITTDIIVGFPGETDEEFEKSLEFVREMDFAGGHVFNYSARPGTPAARMSGQVPAQLRKVRSEQMREVLAESAQRFQQQFLGETLEVLWEATHAVSQSGWSLSGLTDNYIRVHANAPQPLWNRLSAVKLLRQGEEGVMGEIVSLCQPE